MIMFSIYFYEGSPKIVTNFFENICERVNDFFCENFFTVFSNKDQMRVQKKNTVSTCSIIVCFFHRPNDILNA